jgi:hypothetical protein
VFAQSINRDGTVRDVPPLSIYEDYRWEPLKSLFGPVTVLISTKNQLAIVLRNGIEIGRSKIGIVGKEAFGSQAYVVLDGESNVASRIVPGQNELNWMQVNVPNGGSQIQTGLDAKAMQRIVVPVDFAKLVYTELKTGSTMLLTDEAINLDGNSTGMTVLTDETGVEDNGN